MADSALEALGIGNAYLKKGQELLATADQELKTAQSGYSPSAARTVKDAMACFRIAEASYRESLEKPGGDRPEALTRLAYVLQQFDDPNQSLRALRDIGPLLRKDQKWQFAHASWATGHLEDALGAFTELVHAIGRGQNPREDRTAFDAEAVRSIGKILLQKGDFRNAWRQLDLSRGYEPVIAPRLWKLPVGEGREAFRNKNVFVLGHQGLGDEINDASCFNELFELAARCVVACDPRLLTLFQRSFSHERVSWMDRFSVNELEREADAADTVVLGTSLPRYFRHSRSDFPRMSYLAADPALVSQWKERLDSDFGRQAKVGIAWRGGSIADENGRSRSLPGAALRELVSAKPAAFVSLQHFYDRGGPELTELEVPGGLITTYAEFVPERDVEQLAAVITALDCVVTVDNANVHLAGALGKRVLTMIPFMPDARWGLTDERTLWYPDVELARQPSPGAWEPVVHQVLERLPSSAAGAKHT